MSFFGAILDAISNAGEEVTTKQKEYASEFARMSDFELKRAYRDAENRPYSNGFLDGIARSDALNKECVARGFIISKSKAREIQTEWKARYDKMFGWRLKSEYEELNRQYLNYWSNDSTLFQASMLKPRLKALEQVREERNR